MVISPEQLCALAEQALNPQNLGGFLDGDVACALEGDDGRVWTGTCIGGYLGLCAEQSAVSVIGTSVASAGLSPARHPPGRPGGRTDEPVPAQPTHRHTAPSIPATRHAAPHG